MFIWPVAKLNFSEMAYNRVAIFKRTNKIQIIEFESKKLNIGSYLPSL